MDYQIKIERTWPYRHHKRGRSSLAPGLYAVPEQVSDEVAQRALAEGMAIKIYVAKAQPEPGEPASAQKKSKRGGRRAKGPAPENKAAHVPENKLPLH